MQIKIHKREAEDIAVLVDWTLLEPFWLRSTFAPVDRSKLIDAYSELWFDKKSSPWGFTLGEIFFRLNKLKEREIVFINGRNRTNLLIKHQNLIPICIEGEIPDDANILRAIVKQLREGDVMGITDLRILSMSEIRKLQAAGKNGVRTFNR
jgi:hypothetical protein